MANPRTALVVGGARCVWADTAAAFRLFTPDIILAVNDIGMVWEPLHYWATLHPQKMTAWVEGRRQRGLSRQFRTVTFPVFELPGSTAADREPFDDVHPYRWPEMEHSGSSGLYGVKAAMELAGAERIVCAGIPLDPDQPHFFEPERPPEKGQSAWSSAKKYRRGWVEAMGHLKGAVKSMSGWTADVLGQPTRAWLEAPENEEGAMSS